MSKISAGAVSFTGGTRYATSEGTMVAVTDDYQVLADESLIEAQAADVTITLPAFTGTTISSQVTIVDTSGEATVAAPIIVMAGGSEVARITAPGGSVVMAALASGWTRMPDDRAETRFNRFSVIPDAADVDVIVVEVAIADATLTLATQPDVARTILITITDDDHIESGTVTVTGIGASGEAVVEAFELAGGSETLETTRALLLVTSIIVSGLTGASIDVGDTIKVGTTVNIGLPATASPQAYGFAEVLVTCDGVVEVTNVVDAAAGLIEFDTAPDAANVYEVAYTYRVS